MQKPVDFLKNAAMRVRQLAGAAPDIAERLNTLADELESEARTLQADGPASDQPDKKKTPAR
jgi:hypothetical protein